MGLPAAERMNLIRMKRLEAWLKNLQWKGRRWWARQSPELRAFKESILKEIREGNIHDPIKVMELIAEFNKKHQTRYDVRHFFSQEERIELSKLFQEMFLQRKTGEQHGRIAELTPNERKALII